LKLLHSIIIAEKGFGYDQHRDAHYSHHSWFRIVIFACLKGFLRQAFFYLAKANLSGQLLPEKISEGE
jgi:hypothetical protein